MELLQKKYNDNYKIYYGYRNIKLFGEEFLNNNKNNCKIIIDNQEQDIIEYYDLQNNENKEILKIILKAIETISKMIYMFSNFPSLSDISNQITNNVTNMNGMFYNCNSLKQLPDIINDY